MSDDIQKKIKYFEGWLRKWQKTLAENPNDAKAQQQIVTITGKLEQLSKGVLPVGRGPSGPRQPRAKKEKEDTEDVKEYKTTNRLIREIEGILARANTVLGYDAFVFFDDYTKVGFRLRKDSNAINYYTLLTHFKPVFLMRCMQFNDTQLIQILGPNYNLQAPRHFDYVHPDITDAEAIILELLVTKLQSNKSMIVKIKHIDIVLELRQEFLPARDDPSSIQIDVFTIVSIQSVIDLLIELSVLAKPDINNDYTITDDFRKRVGLEYIAPTQPVTTPVKIREFWDEEWYNIDKRLKYMVEGIVALATTAGKTTTPSALFNSGNDNYQYMKDIYKMSEQDVNNALFTLNNKNIIKGLGNREIRLQSDIEVSLQLKKVEDGDIYRYSIGRMQDKPKQQNLPVTSEGFIANNVEDGLPKNYWWHYINIKTFGFRKSIGDTTRPFLFEVGDIFIHKNLKPFAQRKTPQDRFPETKYILIVQYGNEYDAVLQDGKQIRAYMTEKMIEYILTNYKLPPYSTVSKVFDNGNFTIDYTPLRGNNSLNFTLRMNLANLNVDTEFIKNLKNDENIYGNQEPEPGEKTIEPLRAGTIDDAAHLQDIGRSTSKAEIIIYNGKIMSLDKRVGYFQEHAMVYYIARLNDGYMSRIDVKTKSELIPFKEINVKLSQAKVENTDEHHKVIGMLLKIGDIISFFGNVKDDRDLGIIVHNIKKVQIKSG